MNEIEASHAATSIGYSDQRDYPNVRIYHSRSELTKLPNERAVRYQPCESKVAYDILQIPGVAGVNLSPFNVLVEKAELWKWEELHTKIMDILWAANIQAIPNASEAKQ